MFWTKSKRKSVSLFVRLWVEICWISRSLVWKQVSLFVRLWVEMKTQWYGRSKVVSASSWGCELKYYVLIPPVLQSASASSWGCELKSWCSCCHLACRSQPLREAVSWNNGGKIQYVRYPMSASSWGCELKYPGSVLGELEAGQPLRKAVSWNKKHDNYYVAGPVVSLFVRLWVEIWHATPYTLRQDRQPLREAVSWNTNNLTAINSK